MSRNDFEYPHPFRATLGPVLELVPAEHRAAVERVAGLHSERDRALEDFLDGYYDLNLADVVVQQGVGVATINPATSGLWGRRFGKSAHVQGTLRFSASSAAAGNGIAVTLPPGWAAYVGGAADLDPPCGTFTVFDAGTANYDGIAYTWAATSAPGIFVGIGWGQGTYIGVTPNFALAVGDYVRLNLTYRLA